MDTGAVQIIWSLVLRTTVTEGKLGRGVSGDLFYLPCSLISRSSPSNTGYKPYEPILNAECYSILQG